jgi:hypothetical protein
MPAHLLVQARLDVLNTLSEIRHLSAQFLDNRRGKAGLHIHAATYPDLPEVIFREAECSRDVPQGRPIAGLIDAMLNLAKRRRGDAGSLSKLPLRDPALLHPVVDDPCHCFRITHVGPPNQG